MHGMTGEPPGAATETGTAPSRVMLWLLVAMTGWGQEEDRRRSQEAGFDHHLVKPVEPDALHQLLAQPR